MHIIRQKDSWRSSKTLVENEKKYYGNPVHYLIKAGSSEAAKGEAVAIDMSGSDSDHGVYASSYHRVISFVADLVRDTNLYTLCP